MLTDLNWIAPGKPFPPLSERDRVKTYEKQEALFAGEHNRVFGVAFANQALEMRIRDPRVSTIINYPQLLSKKTADFVCGEPPLVEIGDETDELNDALDNMNFSSTLYEAFIDVSRFGNSVVKTLADRVSIVPPKYWFPVVDPYDKKKITHQVGAFVTNNSIFVEIHERGVYETRLYALEHDRADGDFLKFGRLINPAERTATNIDENAIQILSNVTSSDSLYGVSDYTAIEDILRQLIWRIFCTERILDKHSAPSLAGPKTIKEKDPITGLWLVKPGNFFEIEDEKTPFPRYITWDGNLDAVRWEIEWLTNQMYTLSEMGAAFLEGAGQGEVNSGRALRLRMTSPLIKAARLVGINDQTVKRIIRSIALAIGISVDTKGISTIWQDGLPNDSIEESEIYERATGGKPYMSQLTAIKRFNDLDAQAAEEELAAIEGEHNTVFEPLEINVGQSGSTDT